MCFIRVDNSALLDAYLPQNKNNITYYMKYIQKAGHNANTQRNKVIQSNNICILYIIPYLHATIAFANNIRRKSIYEYAVLRYIQAYGHLHSHNANAHTNNTHRTFSLFFFMWRKVRNGPKNSFI